MITCILQIQNLRVFITHQTGTASNVNRGTLGRTKTVPGGNLDLHKGMQCTLNGKHVGKFKI